MKKVYISHAFGGSKANIESVKEKIIKLNSYHPEICFISPIHCFSFLYDITSYEQGMEYCYALLEGCDEMWVCSEDSKGVTLEREFCWRNGIKVLDKIF